MEGQDMRSRFAATAVLSAGCLLTVGVCGCSASTSARSSGSSTSSADVLAVWQQFAVCARAHGAPSLPDPQLVSGGRVSFPGFDASAAPDSVRISCQRILDRLPQTSRPDAAPTDIPALLRFAQCMRNHAFPDWPDPKADGTFPSAQLPAMKTPAFIAAMRSCDHLNPDQGGHVYGS
jgi:hypothetical protein